MTNYTREKKIAILMEDKCTMQEATKYVDSTTVTFYTKSELLEELNYWEDADEIKQMVETQKALSDWSIVEYEGEIYYISYYL